MLQRKLLKESRKTKMKWGGFGIRNWDDMWKAVLSIAIIIIIVFMLVDFISWRTALDIIKKDLPTNYQIPKTEYVKGLGYIPLIWRGNFQFIRVWIYNKPDSLHIDNILLKFTGYNQISINLEKISNNTFYGNYEMTESCKEYIARKLTGWEKMNQPVGEFADVYVRIDGNKVLVLIMGQDRTYLREFKTTISQGNCGGGYYVYEWGKL